MSSIKNIGTKREPVWQVRWRDDDGSQRARRFPRKVDAESFQTEIEHAILTGGYVSPTAGNVTVRDWWSTWSELQTWAPSTRQRHAINFRTHIAPRLGDRPIGKVRKTDLQAVITESGLGPSTCKVLRSTLVSLFRGAVDDRLIAQSPANGLTVPKAGASVPRPLTDDEIGALLGVCDPWERSWLLFGVGTGVRISEALAVRLETLDFLGRTVHIVDQALTLQSGPAQLAPLKNVRPREIPLTEALALTLSRHLEIYGTGEHGVLFPGADGHLWRRQRAGHRFAAIVSRARLDGHVSWHNLRDTAATTMLRDGLNPAYVAKVIGNTVPVLLDRYAGVLPEDTERARDSLERLTARAAAY